MKTRKFLFAAAVPLLMAALAGCSSGGGSSSGFTLSYYDSGFGTSWVKEVTEAYTEKTGVKIKLKKSSDNEDTQSQIFSNGGNADVYQIEVGMFSSNGRLLDLTDVYNSKNEDGDYVKDKIESRWVDFYNEDDHWYQLPQTVTNGFNWVYNKTTIDNALGAGKWSVPNTTDEFFALGDELDKHNVFLTAFAGGDTSGGNYMQYATELWFAQMTGSTGYDDYYGGYYYDEDGTKKFALEEPTQILNARDDIQEAYKVAYKLFTKTGSTQYCHTYSSSMKYLDVDTIFYNGGFNGQDSDPAAFIYTGSWLESEIESKKLIEYGYIEDGQEALAMKMPVVSGITKVLENTSMSDATLSAIISEIDAGSTSSTLCSQNDFDRIKDARNMVAELVCREFVVQKNAKNPDEIKAFLVWLTTNEAQKIASKATGGNNVLPYGYDPLSDTSRGYEISEFLESFLEIKKTSVIIEESSRNRPYKTVFELPWFKSKTGTTSGTLSSSVFRGAMDTDAAKSEDYVQTLYDSVNSNYDHNMQILRTNYPDYPGFSM